MVQLFEQGDLPWWRLHRHQLGQDVPPPSVWTHRAKFAFSFAASHCRLIASSVKWVRIAHKSAIISCNFNFNQFRPNSIPSLNGVGREGGGKGDRWVWFLRIIVWFLFDLNLLYLIWFIIFFRYDLSSPTVAFVFRSRRWSELQTLWAGWMKATALR